MRSGRHIGLATLILAGVCFAGSYAISQDKPGKAAGSHGQSASEGAGNLAGAPSASHPPQDDPMKAMMEAGKAGSHHKILQSMAGKFRYVNKFRMDPSQEWQSSEGDYEGNVIHDGRFLLFHVTGNMMGMPFEGNGALGYDNALKKHVAAWIDNMATGIMRSEGTCADDCKTMTFEGEMMDPMQNKMCKYKYVYEIKSNDEFSMRWWSPNPANGEMFESMQIMYARVK